MYYLLHETRSKIKIKTNKFDLSFVISEWLYEGKLLLDHRNNTFTRQGGVRKCKYEQDTSWSLQVLNTVWSVMFYHNTHWTICFTQRNRALLCFLASNTPIYLSDIDLLWLSWFSSPFHIMLIHVCRRKTVFPSMMYFKFFAKFWMVSYFIFIPCSN